MNPFYIFSPQFVPGSLARAGDVNTQYTLVQTGFDKINTGSIGLGTDSGAVNSVVLTMTTTRTAYTDGDEFVFKPAVQNTGATVIKADGLPTIPLVRFNGAPLQAADLLTTTWYSARYIAAINSIQITSPAAYTASAGVVSTAAPINKVGLAAAGGVSNNVLPIDAAFALDQSIAPTWTAVHTFSAKPVLNAGVTVNAATRNVASLAQSAQSYGNTTDNPTYSFLGTGSFTVGGNISAANFSGFANPSASIGLTAVNGSATTAMRSDATPALSQAISPTWTGVHIFTPASGIAITTNGASNQNAAWFKGSSTASQSFGPLISAGTNSSDYAILIQNQARSANFLGVGGSGAISMGPTNNSLLVSGTTGAVTVNAPSSGSALSVTGVANSAALNLSGSSTSGQSKGIFVNAGTTSADWGLRVQNQAGTANYFGVSGDGSIFAGPNGSSSFAVSATSNVTIGAPSSGVAITATGVANANAGVFQGSATTGQSFGLTVSAGTNSSDVSLGINNTSGSATYFRVRGDGVVFGNDGTNLFELGYKSAPFNFQPSNYTLVVADRGKTINTGSNITITVPSGVFSSGDVVLIRVASGATVTVAQGSGMTLDWAGNGSTTGNRTATGEALVGILFQSGSAATIAGAGLS